MRKLLLFCCLALLSGAALPVLADTIISSQPRAVVRSPDLRPKAVELILKDHRFIPNALTLMPGERVILRVLNYDESAEQFESRYLKRQKIIPGKTAVDIAIGPLKPGVYDFSGTFHADTAQGRIHVPQLGWGESYRHQQ